MGDFVPEPPRKQNSPILLPETKYANIGNLLDFVITT
jgi:hypothetical protein